MRYFFSLVLLSFRQQSTYRVSMWAGLATNLFFGLLRVAVFMALYGQQKIINGLPISGAITYVGLSQASIAYLSLFGSYEIMRSVYSGAISTDLLKPVHFFTYSLAKDGGRALMDLLGRGVLFMLFFRLFYPISLPASIGQWSAFGVAVILSWLVSFSWRFLVNLAAFWTPDAQGIGRIAFTFSQVFSGFVFPLRMLPDWFAAICNGTPFPSMINTPIEIFLGTANQNQILPLLLFQLFWFLALMVLGQLVYFAGVRKLVIQGG